MIEIYFVVVHNRVNNCECSYYLVDFQLNRTLTCPKWADNALMAALMSAKALIVLAFGGLMRYIAHPIYRGIAHNAHS